MNKFFVSLSLLMLVLAAACGGDDERGPRPSPTLADSTDVKSSPPATSGTVAASTPRPASSSGETFQFQSTADGQTMKAHLYANQGAKRKVVILAHGASEDQAAWAPFAQELQGRGIAAVTFDFRGYGETGGAKDPTKLGADLEVAVRYLKSQDWPLVYIVGSDIGGTAALKVAATAELAGVAAISSLPSVSGLDATAEIPQIAEPKLFLAGGGDMAANTAVLTMGNAARDPKTTVSVQGASAHGIALLQEPVAKQALLTFLGPP